MEKIIEEKELRELLSNFYGKEFTEASKKEQQGYIDSYRNVEARNIEQIKKAGGVKKWYASGQGRVI